MLKRIFAFLILFLVAWMFYWALFIPKESLSGRITRELERQSAKLDLFMRGVVFSEIVDGKKYWEIKALTSQINKDTGQALLSDVNGTFFSSDVPSLSFTAPSVVWDMKGKEIKIDRPKGSDGNYRFTVPDLSWSLGRDSFWTDGAVILEGNNGSVRGKGLYGSPGKSGMTVKGSPVAVFSKGRTRLDLRADSFSFNASGDITADGSCEASMDDLSVTADRMKYSKSRMEISALGKVAVRYHDIKASSDRAVFSVGGSTVMLSGRASALRQGSSMKAGRLKIDMKNNRIVMEERTEVFVEEGDLGEQGR